MQIKNWQCVVVAAAGLVTMSGCASSEEVSRLRERVAYLQGRLDEQREMHHMMMAAHGDMMRDRMGGPMGMGPGPGGPGGPGMMGRGMMGGPGNAPGPGDPPRGPNGPHDHPRGEQPPPPPGR
jgi:hypothetical protein